MINHLTTEASLRETLAEFRRILRPGGVLIFDVNTLRVFCELLDGITYETSAGRYELRARNETAVLGGSHQFTITALLTCGGAASDTA